MPTITNIDLRTHPQAAVYLKSEIVDVIFAAEAGALQSREGLNRYSVGDALITGSTGDRWSVSRDRFDAKYSPVGPLQPGEGGRYLNIPLPVLAVQISEDFSISRSNGGDLIHGRAGDWLMQYAPGDHGIVDREKFARVYRRADTANRAGE
jgi:hypothetical protein